MPIASRIETRGGGCTYVTGTLHIYFSTDFKKKKKRGSQFEVFFHNRSPLLRAALLLYEILYIHTSFCSLTDRNKISHRVCLSRRLSLSKNSRGNRDPRRDRAKTPVSYYLGEMDDCFLRGETCTALISGERRHTYRLSIPPHFSSRSAIFPRRLALLGSREPNDCPHYR